MLFLQRHAGAVAPGNIYRATDQRSRIDNDTIGNCQMPDNVACPTYLAATANVCATSDANTTCYGRMATDRHVVSDLYLIVEDDIRFNDSGFYGAAIDGCVSTDMHPLANAHPANLPYLQPLTRLPGKAKTFRANDGTRLDSTI